MDEDFRRRLVAIDDALGRVPLPRGLEARVLESRGSARGGAWMVLAGATAAAILAFLVGRQTAPKPDANAIHAAAEPAHEAPIEPLPSACPSMIATQGATVLPMGCTVAITTPGMTIAAHTPARLVRTQRGVRMLDGDAFFAVAKVEPGRPTVQVEVDGGTIEVLGTRFVVHQAGESGHVDLLEGEIEFTGVDGHRRAVDPGHRVYWADGTLVDDAPTGQASSAAGHEASTRKRGADHDASAEPTIVLDAVLDEVATLRRRGQYREAARLLRNTRASIQGAAESEILSYEEGTLREHYQAQEAACAFWRGHMRRFGDDGRYASAVTHRLSRLGCTER